MDSTINVVYAVDIDGIGAQQFCDELFCSIASLDMNRGPDDRFSVYVLYANFPAWVMDNLSRLRSDTLSIEFLRLPEKDLNYMQSFSRHPRGAAIRCWSGIVYTRIFIPKFLPHLDRCIYLDADTMVVRSLKPLWEMDLGGKTLGMNRGPTYEYGYNSGVILMDLSKMKSDETLYTRLGEFMKENALKYNMPDQTLINEFFRGDIHEIGREWNFPPEMYVKDPVMKKAGILHFYAGKDKPYNMCRDDYSRSFIMWNNVYSKAMKAIKGVREEKEDEEVAEEAVEENTGVVRGS